MQTIQLCSTSTHVSTDMPTRYLCSPKIPPFTQNNADDTEQTGGWTQFLSVNLVDLYKSEVPYLNIYNEPEMEHYWLPCLEKESDLQ